MKTFDELVASINGQCAEGEVTQDVRLFNSTDSQSPFSIVSQGEVRMKPEEDNLKLGLEMSRKLASSSNENDFSHYSRDILPNAMVELMGPQCSAHEIVRFMRQSDDDRVPTLINLLHPLTKCVEELSKGLAFHFGRLDLEELHQGALKLSRTFFEMVTSHLHNVSMLVRQLGTSAMKFQASEYVLLLFVSEVNSVFADCFGHVQERADFVDVYLMDALINTIQSSDSRSSFIEWCISFPTVSRVLEGAPSVVSKWLDTALSSARRNLFESESVGWRVTHLEKVHNTQLVSGGVRGCSRKVVSVCGVLSALGDCTHGCDRQLLLVVKDEFFRDVTLMLAQYLDTKVSEIAELDSPLLSTCEAALRALLDFHHLQDLLVELNASADVFECREGSTTVRACEDVAKEACDTMVSLTADKLCELFHVLLNDEFNLGMDLLALDKQVLSLIEPFKCSPSWTSIVTNTSISLAQSADRQQLDALRERLLSERCLHLCNIMQH